MMSRTTLYFLGILTGIVLLTSVQVGIALYADHLMLAHVVDFLQLLANMTAGH